MALARVTSGEREVAPARRAISRATVAMDTVVSATVVVPGEDVAGEDSAGGQSGQIQGALERALAWFGVVEGVCSRFDAQSELRRVCATSGRAVPASTLLLELVRFGLRLARLTGGAFDPAVGGALAQRGFDRHYVTGERVAAPEGWQGATYRDVRAGARGTITLRRPLLLDLNALAKGLAIDLAARELSQFADVCIEAGGDLYLRGRNEDGSPWRVGIQHPVEEDLVVHALTPGDGAVCTSGGYERRAPAGEGHHLVDARTGRAVESLASVTVMAPTALVADGLATAAFLLGPRRGARLLEAEGVEGVFVLPSLAVRATRGLRAAGGAGG